MMKKNWIDLDALYQGLPEKGFLLAEGEELKVVSYLSTKVSHRRTWGILWMALVHWMQKKEGLNEKEAATVIRQAFSNQDIFPFARDLPSIIGDDLFLRLYAKGTPVSIDLFRKIFKSLRKSHFTPPANPLYVREVLHAGNYFDIKATPPGILPKLFSSYRLRKEPILLACVQSDLDKVAEVSDPLLRKMLILSLLTFGACYRDLEGQLIYIPSIKEKGGLHLVPYSFREHLLWEGIKTISAKPLENEAEEPGLYLCQGTEIWPSQSSILGSLFANMAREGPATEPYARCWRQIHRHLKELKIKGGPHPIVAGHSMGGALATQIALYSHPLISEGYAFNPPVVEERDYQVYHRLSKRVQNKLKVYANLDDLPFWRIGAKIIGRVTVLLSAERTTYRPIHRWEILTLLPAIVKGIINLVKSFPSHQRIYPLVDQCVLVPLSSEEIRQENEERLLRPDHWTFLSRFYVVFGRFLRFRRKFRWKKKMDYLASQLEILELHEKEILETTASDEEGPSMLEEIHNQKLVIQEMLEKERKKS